MKYKFYSSYKAWSLIYFLPVALFVVGTLFGAGDQGKKIEVYVIGVAVAISLTFVSRYSTYVQLDDENLVLSALFVKRRIKLSDIENTGSTYSSIFGSSIESLQIILKNHRRTGVFSGLYDTGVFQQVKRLISR